MKLSLIIPAYNEENRISKAVGSFSVFLDKKYDYELIIVCDGNDSTAGIVKSMKARHPRIRLLEFPTRQGKGGAIIEGFKESSGDMVGFVDSDDSISPAEFEKLITALNSTDCAIASRRADGARVFVPQPRKRRVLSKIFNMLVNLIFNLGVKDTQCGAKIFKKDILTPLLFRMKTKGFEFDVELLWRIKNGGFKIKEIPVEWKHEDGSTFSLKHSGMMFLNLLKVRLLSNR